MQVLLTDSKKGQTSKKPPLYGHLSAGRLRKSIFARWMNRTKGTPMSTSPPEMVVGVPVMDCMEPEEWQDQDHDSWDDQDEVGAVLCCTPIVSNSNE